MINIFPNDFIEKTTPADEDKILLSDSADSNKIKYGKFSKFKGVKGDTGNPGTDGKSFVPKGAYSAGTAYVVNDVVSYLGSSWIALQSTTGNAPVEGAYRTLNAAKGTDGAGSGTVTTVSVTTANGVSGAVSNPTTIPAITLTLGAITPSSVASTGTVTGTNLSGTNTGDQFTSTTASRLIGRGSASAGAAQEITLGTNLSMSGTTINATGGGAYRTAVPGTPTRTGNTTFTVTDTSNANKYDLLLSRGVVLKWTESSVVKQAMIITATYATNTVTVTIVGDTMTSIDASSLKYGANKAREVNFTYPMNVGTGTDIMGNYYASSVMKVHGAIAYHGTAGTTNATTYDVNKNGTTMFTTKLSVASAGTVGTFTSADNGSSLSVNDIVTVDCDSVSTTVPVYATVKLYMSPYYDYLLA